MLDVLFVYGTLRRNFENKHARLLRESAEFVREAEVRGRIYRMGWYPGFVSADDGSVRGELYRLRNPETTLAALDKYEGFAFERALVDVEGTPAWIYRLRALPAGAEPIASGDFCA